MNPIYILTILLKNLSHNNSLNLHNDDSHLSHNIDSLLIYIIIIPPLHNDDSLLHNNDSLLLHEEKALSFIHEIFEKEINIS
jgi:hypothetical protein